MISYCIQLMITNTLFGDNVMIFLIMVLKEEESECTQNNVHNNGYADGEDGQAASSGFAHFLIFLVLFP